MFHPIHPLPSAISAFVITPFKCKTVAKLAHNQIIRCMDAITLMINFLTPIA